MAMLEEFLTDEPGEVVDLNEVVWWVPCAAEAGGPLPAVARLEGDDIDLEGVVAYTTRDACLAGIVDHELACVPYLCWQPGEFCRWAEARGLVVFVDLKSDDKGCGWETYTLLSDMVKA